ncbi:MAG: hypothetical protein JXL80_17335 [Planctomycetes bacterium]|nr:hypothetical protein [Planctomycetota bacterium]
MSYIPSDLTSRIAEEVTFGDIFRRAWDTHKKYGLTVVLYMLLLMVAYIAASCVIGCIPVVGPLALAALVAVPVMASLVWSIVLAYDGRRPQLDDLFLGFRTHYNCLAVIGLIQAAFQLVPIIATFAFLGLAMFAPATGGRPIIGTWRFEMSRVVLQLGQYVYNWLLEIAFFLAPLFVFTVATPKPVECIKTNLRVLRNRPGHFLATLFVPIGMMLILMLLVSPLIGFGFYEIVSVKNLQLGIPLLIAGGLIFLPLALWVVIFGLFLKAAFFRSVCGYTLAEPEPGEVAPFAAAPIVASPVAGMAPAPTPSPYLPPEPRRLSPYDPPPEGWADPGSVPPPQEPPQPPTPGDPGAGPPRDFT